MHVSIMDRSPSNTASTLPSHRFSTYPSSPNDSAFSAQYARKLTPCTRPRKTTTARAFTTKRIETKSKNFIVAIADSHSGCRGGPQQATRQTSDVCNHKSNAHSHSPDGISTELRRNESGPDCGGITSDARELLAQARSVLDLGTGAGELFAELCAGYHG